MSVPSRAGRTSRQERPRTSCGVLPRVALLRGAGNPLIRQPFRGSYLDCQPELPAEPGCEYTPRTAFPPLVSYRFINAFRRCCASLLSILWRHSYSRSFSSPMCGWRRQGTDAPESPRPSAEVARSILDPGPDWLPT